MITNIAYFLILGKPLIMYLGILTLLCFLSTAYLGYRLIKGNFRFPIKYHLLLAKIAITLAIIHMILGLAPYFKL
jgi:thiosulfate reductase cytochrome b subunit